MLPNSLAYPRPPPTIFSLIMADVDDYVGRSLLPARACGSCLRGVQVLETHSTQHTAVKSLSSAPFLFHVRDHSGAENGSAEAHGVPSNQPEGTT